jgi:hypothetical protein
MRERKAGRLTVVLARFELPTSPNHGPGTPRKSKEISKYNRQFAGVIGMLPNFQQEDNPAYANQPHRIHLAWHHRRAGNLDRDKTAHSRPSFFRPKNRCRIGVGL